MAGVQFTGEAAKRIANVVRTVEAGPRGVQPVDWGMPRLDGVGGIVFRMATYTGSWTINTDNTVKFLSNTEQTALARNILLTLPEATEDRNCAVAKDGTAWFLINWQQDVVTAFTAAELSSATLAFHGVPVAALSTAGTEADTISVVNCGTSTAS
jgi:hypothetical protein